MTKKILSSFIIAGLLLSAAAVYARDDDNDDDHNNYKFNRSLYRGHRGDDVYALQAFLALDKDIYPEGVISGYFGELTEKAVKRYQKKHGLEQVGIAGPKTRTLIMLSLSNGSTITVQVPGGIATTLGITATTTVSSSTIVVEQRREPEPRRNHATTTRRTKEHITICHIPPGNPSNSRTLTVGIPSLVAHLRHGDKIGPCQATTTPPTVDTTPPVISSLSAGSISSTTATLSWQTDEVADGMLWWSISTPLDPLASTTSMQGTTTLTTSHSFNLFSLLASTTYYYLVKSKDSAGNTATSAEKSFATTSS